MITVVDERLRREASALELRFTCDHCAHFASDQRACGNGYPVAAHYGVDLARVDEVTFCKDFELA
ncbi:MAG: hypothetical protein HS104_31275 [Polyangiaceae bacterium]|nr:hypothetical protein [Polyangiaceae bacterium]MBK8996353.1 hypothetical protein [Myxococcales bacterium]MCE7889756.1 hypothetical protein [Sorangiineae bacterium PRO1]